MDLYSVKTYLRPKSLREVQNWQPNWNWLAGGTWIFNEVQPQVTTLVDLLPLNWSEIKIKSDVKNTILSKIDNLLVTAVSQFTKRHDLAVFRQLVTMATAVNKPLQRV